MLAENNSELKAGRLVGAFLLMQLVGGILINMFLTAPLTGTPGFMTNGVLYAQQLGASVIFSLIISGLSIAVAVVAFDTIRTHSKAAALGVLTLSAVELSANAVENISIMSLVSYSEAYAQVTAVAQREMIETLKVIVVGLRNWAHYTNLLISGAALLVLYGVLYGYRLVPRVIAGFGVLASLSQLTTISMPFFGQSVIFEMLAPIGLSQIILSLWLIAKGFRSKI